MLRFLTDENFDSRILKGLKRRNPAIDAVCVQDVGLYRTEDPEVLAWAARERRVVLTHDVSTMTRYAYERVLAGKGMPGVFEVSSSPPSIGQIIEDLLLLAECSLEGEWEGQIVYLPL